MGPAWVQLPLSDGFDDGRAVGTRLRVVTERAVISVPAERLKHSLGQCLGKGGEDAVTCAFLERHAYSGAIAGSPPLALDRIGSPSLRPVARLGVAEKCDFTSYARLGGGLLKAPFDPADQVIIPQLSPLA